MLGVRDVRVRPMQDSSALGTHLPCLSHIMFMVIGSPKGIKKGIHSLIRNVLFVCALVVLSR